LQPMANRATAARVIGVFQVVLRSMCCALVRSVLGQNRTCTGKRHIPADPQRIVRWITAMGCGGCGTFPMRDGEILPGSV